MKNYKLIINGSFRSTIKGTDENDIRRLAMKIYGFDADIKVVLLS